MKLPPLIEGRLLRRYKRFLADIELPDQGVVVCHCPNPGSMRNCAPEGARVWVSRSDNPRRKLPHTWELVEESGALICVNTMRANQVVAEALRSGAIAELAGVAPPEEIRSEVRIGGKTRLDFALGDSCYVEVKSVTLGVGGGVSAFPDSVTARGARHVRELATLCDGGCRAVMLFCVGRTDTRRVRPADEIDPVYGMALRQAASQGVEILAYRADIDLAGMRLAERVPVDLARLET